MHQFMYHVQANSLTRWSHRWVPGARSASGWLLLLSTACILDRLLPNGHNTRSVPTLGRGIRSPDICTPPPLSPGSTLLVKTRRPTFNQKLTLDQSSAWIVSPQGHNIPCPNSAIDDPFTLEKKRCMLVCPIPVGPFVLTSTDDLQILARAAPTRQMAG